MSVDLADLMMEVHEHVRFDGITTVIVEPDGDRSRIRAVDASRATVVDGRCPRLVEGTESRFGIEGTAALVRVVRDARKHFGGAEVWIDVENGNPVRLSIRGLERRLEADIALIAPEALPRIPNLRNMDWSDPVELSDQAIADMRRAISLAPSSDGIFAFERDGRHLIARVGDAGWRCVRVEVGNIDDDFPIPLCTWESSRIATLLSIISNDEDVRLRLWKDGALRIESRSANAIWQMTLAGIKP